MAVQVETQGQLQEFLDVLRRRKWQVALPAAMVLSLSVFFAVVVPKKFVVKTQVELRPVGVSISTKEASNAPFQLRSLARIRKVAQELQNREYLALPPDEQFDWLDDVQKKVRVTLASSSNQGSSFVNIEYSDVQREWAADFLRALRRDWIEDVVERDRRKAQDELSRLREARAQLEREYSAEEERLTELMRINGLSATQPVPGADATRTEDPVFERLRRNEAELDAVKREAATVQVRVEYLRQSLEEMPRRLDREETVISGTSNEAELEALDREIVAAQKLLSGIKPPHSDYKKTQARIRELETQREQLARIVTRNELQKTSVPNPALDPLRRRIDELEGELKVAEARKTRLQADIDTDRARVAELQDVYREVRERKERTARLSAELATAGGDYQAKLREVDLLLSPLANPFEITQEVALPSKPTEPNPFLIVTFGLIAGLGLGLGLVLFLEYSRNCFRTVADVTRVMAVPVLGSVASIVTRRERRLRAVRRALVAASSLVFVGSVLFVTWAWAQDAKYLSQDLRDAIEGLRAAFK